MSDAVTPPDSDAFEAAKAAQAEAADPSLSAWVSANAGSGKTKVLIDRVARLLLQDTPPDSILCVTYTKAAANEMLERLFDRLGKWSIMPDAPLRTELGALEGRNPNGYSKTDTDRARALFAKALETPGGLRIETIHAFCARVLRRFPLEAGMPPGFREVEDDVAEALWTDALHGAVAAAAPEDLARIGRDSVGGDAIQSLSALRFVSETDAERAFGALGESEAEVIEKAMAAELPRKSLEAALSVLAASDKGADCATAEAVRAALSDAPAAVRWRAYLAAFRTAKGEWRKANPYTKECSDPIVERLFQMKAVPEGSEIIRMKAVEAARKAAAAAERTEALLRVGLPARRRFGALKRARATVDFDDLISYTRRLFTEAASAAWVLYKLDGGLTHVLLDEAQDTSPDQWTLLNALVAEFFAGAGAAEDAERTLFVVGDEKQSIYSFQGADPDRFVAERQAFAATTQGAGRPGALPAMEMSFRSSPEVLRFVDEVFNAAEFDTPPFSSAPPAEADLVRHAARRANQPGLVELWPIEPPEEAPEADPWDAPLDRLSPVSPKARLARQVALTVREMIDRGDAVWAENEDRSWSRRAMTPGDVLILVQNRTGGLFDQLIAQLKAAGLPVAGADRLKLAEHIAVQDCLNLARFALLPEDDLALAEILRGPFGGLVDDDAHLFPLAYGRAEGETLWDRLQASSDPAHAMIRSVLRDAVARRSLPPFEFFSTLLESPSFDGATGWDRLTARLGPPALDPVEALLAKALSHDAAGPSSLQIFVAGMERDESEIKRDLAAPDGAVRVMTVHGAKGLQSPVVILPDTTRPPKGSAGALFHVDGALVWSPTAADDTDEIAAARQGATAKSAAEHRRLLYVALTRAQDRLVICGSWHGRRPSERGGAVGFSPMSWYGLCRAGMERLGVEGLARFGAPPPQLIGDVREAAAADTPAWLRAPAPKEPALRRFAAPSALFKDETRGAAPFAPGRAQRLARGRLIHGLLQHLPELPETEREAAGRAYLARETEFSDEARAEMLAAALGVLEDLSFAEVFAPGGRAEAAVVGAAPGLPNGMVINGRVDRLVVTDASVLIVDYKTDRPPPANPGRVGRAYLAQMAAYRAVLREAYPGREVRCALVWTDGPKLMALPDALLDEIFSTVAEPG